MQRVYHEGSSKDSNISSKFCLRLGLQKFKANESKSKFGTNSACGFILLLYNIYRISSLYNFSFFAYLACDIESSSNMEDLRL